MSDPNEPLVSVVIPVKNGMPYIRDALQSMWEQTYKNLEVVVVDDGSTDGAPEWVASLNHPRVRLVGARRRGALGAQLTGYHAASGSLVANLDHDDVSLPRRIEAQVDFLHRNPSVVAAGTQVRFLVDNFEAPAFPYPTDPDEVIAVTRRGRPGVCNPSVMLRTPVARTVEPRVFGPGGDVDFYLRLGERGAITNLAEVLHLMRLHESAQSFRRIGEQLCEIAYAVAADQARRRGDLEPDFEAFRLEWRRRSAWARLMTELRIQHQRAYRRSVMAQAKGNRLRGLAYLV